MNLERKKLGRIEYIDKYLILAIARHRAIGLTTLMKIMTKIGDGYVWGFICIVIAFINFHAGLAMMIGSVAQVVIQQIVKHIFNRERPYVTYDDIYYIIPPPDKFSFPSGHTAGAFVMVFALFHFYPAFFSIMLVAACLIAFSRVYLGLHYPSDIVAGILLGYISYKIGIVAANFILLHN